MEINSILKFCFNTGGEFFVNGLIYGIGALGLALSLKFLKFPDFTVFGSIMVGGVVCIVATTQFNNSFVGIIFGAIAGGLLGLITGLLTKFLKIQRVLSGIIAFTSAFSFSYIIAGGAQIKLPKFMVVMIDSSFRTRDFITILIIIILICLLITFIITTKFGSLLLAMLANERYLKFRHRYSNRVFIITIVFANALVGLCGGLSALYSRTAEVTSPPTFLPIALGAIFGGNAITLFFSKKLHENKIVGIETEYVEGDRDIQLPAIQTKGPGIFLRAIYSTFSVERMDSKKIGLLYFSYAAGCLFLNLIYGIVFLQVDFKIAHLIVAFLIAFFVWWAGSEESEN
jgi:putative tryptophan/tyrosine transport system permease protein